MDAAPRSDRLAPYVPTLVRRWMAETPDRRWRTLEGSLAFVDVSGFTQLSESLAAGGKIGAEQLTETIGASFARLLTVAYDNGGSLLKFGGDALLLVFEGDDHPCKAARASAGMHRILRKIGQLETPDGPVRLQMSIGVHSGTFHLFLVGGSHRELLVTGPGATTTVRLEAAAAPGEVLLSAATASALPPDVLGAPKGPGQLLERAPPGVVDSLPFAASPGDELLRPCIPAALREQLCAGVRDPLHRRVTVAFLRYRGVDALIAEVGVEETAHHLDALVREVQHAVDSRAVTFIGSDVDVDGGRLLLAAGAPSGTGNDEERMLLALRELVEGEPRIPLHVGVNNGHVFAGDIGPPYRRTYTVMGDAVNLAARLMANAKPGRILAAESVVAPSRTTFGTLRLAPFTVKGRSQLVHAREVGPVVGARSYRTAASLPLVGRERELSLCDSALEATRAGSGQVIEIVGEPGIGKSRLVEAFRERATGFAVLRMPCELYRSSTPYAPFRRLLRALAGIPEEAGEDAAARLRSYLARQAPRLEPWAPLLGTAMDIEMPPTPETASLDLQFRRPRLHAAVHELLRELWATPVLLTVEDAHWMDEASADLLAYLTERVTEHPWFVCVTRRETDAGFRATSGPGVTSHRLEPLDGDAMRALADEATGEPLPPHEMAVLVQRSEGNPLFLQELVAAARAAGGLEGLPDSIETLVTARIDRLRPVDRTALRHAAVLGHTFTTDLAESVLPPEVSSGETTWQRLEDFLARDGETIHFRHALIRDAAYESLPYRVRRRLHAEVGDTLEAAGDTREQAELLSFHFFLADRFPQAWTYSRTAAEEAARIYANADAARFYHRALASANRLDDLPAVEVSPVAEALGDVLQRIGDFAKAGKAYRQARHLADEDVVDQARLLLKQGQVEAWLRRYSNALSSIKRGLGLLEDADGPQAAAQRAQLMVWHGHFCQEQGRHVDAIQWCRRAIEEAQAAGDKDALAHAYRVLDWTYADSGQPEKAVHSQAALALYEELGDLQSQATVLNNMGGIAYWRGQWDDALTFYRRASELDRRTGDVVGAAFGQNNIGEVLADQGRLEEAEELFAEAERTWRATGYRGGIAYVKANRGRVAARAGRFEEALRLLGEARDGSEEVGAEVEALETYARIAECHVLRGDGGAALASAEDALARAEALDGVAAQGPLLNRVRGYALMQIGDLAQARLALAESLRMAETRKADYEWALTVRALAQLAEVTGRAFPQDLLARSQAVLDRLGVVRLPEVPRPDLVVLPDTSDLSGISGRSRVAGT